MVKQWIKRMLEPDVAGDVSENRPVPVGLTALHPDGGDPRQLVLNSARDFLDKLSFDSLSDVQFEKLHHPPMTIQKAFKAGLLSWSNTGLTIVMRKDSNRFDIDFSDLWTKLRSIGVGESKKILVDNRILWTWKWEMKNAVCNLSYWNSLNHNGDEGLKFRCTLRAA